MADKILKPDNTYLEAIGRRKSSTARVRIMPKGERQIIVNGKSLQDYFKLDYFIKTALESMDKMKSVGRFGVSIKVMGGGLKGQAEAIRLGLARALIKFNPDFRKRLKRAGYLTRDARVKERKKPGLKKARRAPQWSKR